MSAFKNSFHHNFRPGRAAAALFCALLCWGCAAQEETVTNAPAVADTQESETPAPAASDTENFDPETLEPDIARISYFTAYYASTDEPRQSPYPILPDLQSGEEFCSPYIICSEDIFCVKDEDAFGYTDADGRWIARPQYDFAYPFSEGMGCVKKDGYYGFINADGEEVIPFRYLDAAPFSDGLAYFCTQDGYGFMNREGVPVFYLDCDSVSSFHDGLAYFSVDGKYGYIDQAGNVALEPVYDDAGHFENGLATVRLGEKTGVIDKAGNLIIPAEYLYIFETGLEFIGQKSNGECDYYTSDGEKITYAQYSQMYGERPETSPDPDISLPDDYSYQEIDSVDLLCTNHITPRRELYWQLAEGNPATVQDMDGTTYQEQAFHMREEDNYYKIFKLFSVDGMGEPVLYCYECPLYSDTSSKSAFYCIQNGRLTKLLSGYNCGVPAGGSRVALQWNREDEKMMIGIWGTAGGIGGFSSYGDIYGFQENIPEMHMSFWSVYQARSSYSEEYLTEHVEQMFSPDGTPFTQDSIWEAETVTEYELNGEKVSPKEYWQAMDAYQQILIL